MQGQDHETHQDVVSDAEQISPLQICVEVYLRT